jgi:hypothetical protein
VDADFLTDVPTFEKDTSILDYIAHKFLLILEIRVRLALSAPRLVSLILTFLSDPRVANPGMALTPFSAGGGWPYDYRRFWYGVYYTNGRDWVIKNQPRQGNSSSNHNEASSGMNAAVAHASTDPIRWKFVEELGGAHQPRRSINGLPATYGDPYWVKKLYLLGSQETSGQFSQLNLETMVRHGQRFQGSMHHPLKLGQRMGMGPVQAEHRRNEHLP